MEQSLSKDLELFESMFQNTGEKTKAFIRAQPHEEWKPWFRRAVSSALLNLTQHPDLRFQSGSTLLKKFTKLVALDVGQQNDTPFWNGSEFQGVLDTLHTAIGDLHKGHTCAAKFIEDLMAELTREREWSVKDRDRCRSEVQKVSNKVQNAINNKFKTAKVKALKSGKPLHVALDEANHRFGLQAYHPAPGPAGPSAAQPAAPATANTLGLQSPSRLTNRQQRIYGQLHTGTSLIARN
ncbi:hypothetical protein C6P46_003876 [Rhodotorula mucilaginosa]|uniref:Uncharacterized protein n=1 Tax=Rhodotorula mucilaginosa TaxID=5537 RepID=A0A9P6W3J6_RHOMI|nr:hypothetical protein C6P46_003876 [Rhodotorula mucilaginosa]